MIRFLQNSRRYTVQTESPLQRSALMMGVSFFSTFFAIMIPQSEGRAWMLVVIGVVNLVFSFVYLVGFTSNKIYVKPRFKHLVDSKQFAAFTSMWCILLLGVCADILFVSVTGGHVLNRNWSRLGLVFLSYLASIVYFYTANLRKRTYTHTSVSKASG